MLPSRSYILIISMLLVVSQIPDAENADTSIFLYRQKRQTLRNVRQYCGGSLSSTLQMICDGSYNSRFKKSNQDMPVNDYPVIYDFHPFKSLENALKMLRHRRNAPGIYEECCVKSCSTAELQSYCTSKK